MKSFHSLLALAFMSISGAVFGQSKTSTFKVSGNCSMCKKTIENAVNLPGVTSANWDRTTKVMTISFDEAKLKSDSLQRRIALAGYDTEKFKAADSVYKELPECCQYQRVNDRATPVKQENQNSH
jgi:copper chaperone CopZ